MSGNKIVDKMAMSNAEYLDEFVFPVLLSSLEVLLQKAEEHQCFTNPEIAESFSAFSFLCHHIYCNNSIHTGRKSLTLEDMPFFKKYGRMIEKYPMKKICLTKTAAAVVIQSAYRGYLVRKRPEVRELREYQRCIRQINWELIPSETKNCNFDTEG